MRTENGSNSRIGPNTLPRLVSIDRRNNLLLLKLYMDGRGEKTRNCEEKPEKWKPKLMRLNRPEEVIIYRLRSGHSLITHGYLLNESSLGQRQICGWCEAAVMTMQHIIFECLALQHERDR